MGVYTSRYDYQWTPYEPQKKLPAQECPRCNNQVSLFLAYDGDAWGFPGLWTYKLKQHFAWVCPICPYRIDLSRAEAKKIIRG